MKVDARRCVVITGLGVAFLASGYGIAIMASASSAEAVSEDAAPNAQIRRLQFNLTPQPLPTAAGAVTPSPTPRVIVIPTSTPGSAPAVTPTPARTPAPTRPVIVTATPQSIVIVAPSATAVSAPAPTATTIPTAIPTPTLSATTSAPTVAPVIAERIEFAAGDWRGGYFQADGGIYGRPWVSVYGALSDYPKAVLAFSLDAEPSGEATVTITGLDDELGTLNPVALDVNGERVYEGPSLFANWDGSAQGVDAAWTNVPLTIPRGVLHAGPNEIGFANLAPVASFDAPPYVLLASAILEIPGGATSEPAEPPGVPIVPSASTASFTAEDWQGGFYRGDDVYYGRPWTALYGADSDYPQAALTFRLDTVSGDPAILTVAGLDDEWSDLNPIAINVNGQLAFEGPSPFLNWDGVGNGEDAAWTQVEITIPADLLRSGRNQIAIANLSPGANFGAPPYVLLGDATVRVPGAEVTAVSRDGARGNRNNRGATSGGGETSSGDVGSDDGGEDDG